MAHSTLGLDATKETTGEILQVPAWVKKDTGSTEWKPLAPGMQPTAIIYKGVPYTTATGKFIYLHNAGEFLNVCFVEVEPIEG